MNPQSCILTTYLDNGEHRVRDTDLAEWLGYSAPAQIRELIWRNSNELSTYGNLSHGTNKTGQRGRPAEVFMLCEGQALLLCTLCRTAKAAEVRKVVIKTFMDLRAGKVVPVKAHRRSMPTGRDTQGGTVKGFAHYLETLRDFSGNQDALLQIFALSLDRLDILERAAFARNSAIV